MGKFIAFLTTLFAFQVNAQFVIPENNDFEGGLPKKYVEYNSNHFDFRSYGETWFTLALELVEIGAINALSSEPGGQLALLIGLFPDSTIVAGVDDVSGKTFYPAVHGIAEIVNPSMTPRAWTDEYAKVFVDSVEIPFVYTRETHDSVVDTLFVDYLIGYPHEYMGAYDFNGNGVMDIGDFASQVIFHTGNTNELDENQVFRTDTVLLTTSDSTSPNNLNVKYRTLGVKDTLEAQERYGVYLRYAPGYDWEITDTLDDFNQFFLLTREQEVGESPLQIWPALSGFCTYTMNRPVRYNDGDGTNTLIHGIIQSPDWPIEHVMISYKFSTNSLSVNEVENTVEIDMFPNPTEDILNLGLTLKESSKLTLEIINLQGKLVFNDHINIIPKGSYNHQLNISSLKPGMYFLKVNDSSKPFIVK